MNITVHSVITYIDQDHLPGLRMSYYLCWVIMKKILVSLAVIVYFIFACGVLVNLHYCMDRYDSFRLYKAASDWCTRCGMHTKNNGCCHDEVKIVKLQDDYQTSSASFAFKNIQPLAIDCGEFLSTGLLKSNEPLIVTGHSPPLLSQQDIYIQNRVFRI